jgi:AcrR family transcriptional regulator
MTGLREEKKQLTRKAIMDASIQLFTSKGYESTSINDLAREAKIGKGTIYSYFKTKREIFLAFCRDELDFIQTEVKENTNDSMAMIEKLLAVFMGTFKFISQNREFGRLLMRESFFPIDDNVEQSRQIDELYINMLVEIFRAGQARGELRNDVEMTFVTGHFYGLFIMTMSAWFTDRLQTEEDVSMALKGLFMQAMQGLGSASFKEKCDER